MHLREIKLADKIWLSIKPVLSDHQVSDIASQLHDIFTEHQIDVAGTDLQAFVKQTGFSVGISTEF
jgi:hypothetical protein